MKKMTGGVRKCYVIFEMPLLDVKRNQIKKTNKITYKALLCIQDRSGIFLPDAQPMNQIKIYQKTPLPPTTLLICLASTMSIDINYFFTGQILHTKKSSSKQNTETDKNTD